MTHAIFKMVHCTIYWSYGYYTNRIKLLIQKYFWKQDKIKRRSWIGLCSNIFFYFCWTAWNHVYVIEHLSGPSPLQHFSATKGDKLMMKCLKLFIEIYIYIYIIFLFVGIFIALKRGRSKRPQLLVYIFKAPVTWEHALLLLPSAHVGLSKANWTIGNCQSKSTFLGTFPRKELGIPLFTRRTMFLANHKFSHDRLLSALQNLSHLKSLFVSTVQVKKPPSTTCPD